VVVQGINIHHGCVEDSFTIYHLGSLSNHLQVPKFYTLCSKSLNGTNITTKSRMITSRGYVWCFKVSFLALDV